MNARTVPVPDVDTAIEIRLVACETLLRLARQSRIDRAALLHLIAGVRHELADLVQIVDAQKAEQPLVLTTVPTSGANQNGGAK